MTGTVPSTVPSSTHDAMSLDSPLASQDGNNLASVFHQPSDSMVHTMPEPSGQVSLSCLEYGVEGIQAPFTMHTLEFWVLSPPRFVDLCSAPCSVWTMYLQLGSLCCNAICTEGLAGDLRIECQDAQPGSLIIFQRPVASFTSVRFP